IEKLHQEAEIRNLELRQKNIFLIAVMAFLGFGIYIVYLLLNRRKLKAEARLREELSIQQEIRVREVFNAEERERRRIAGDLHDGIGQTLSAALMNVNGLIENIEIRDAEQSSLAERSLALLNESYDELRSVSHQMMPNAL